MPKFEEFMQAFSYNPETFDPEAFKAAMTAAHEADVNTVASALTAREEEVSKLNTKVTELGADNWKLFLKLGQGPDITPVPPAGTQVSGGSADDDGEEAPLPRLADAFTKEN